MGKGLRRTFEGWYTHCLPAAFFVSRMRPYLFVPLLLLCPALVAQEQVTIHGTAYSDERDRAYHDLMVVNKRTRTGFFGNADGSFTIQALRTDTIMVGATGLRTAFVCVADSAPKAEYRVKVYLEVIHYVLKEAEVFPRRKLEEIQKDIADLGYDERDYQLSGIDALQSPITFLYQEFSKRERSKREVAYLRNEDRKRDLLKELLRKYVSYDIINLNSEAFDDFIDFCKVPDETIKGLSQYDFIQYMKKKYELYSSLGPTRRH